MCCKTFSGPPSHLQLSCQFILFFLLLQAVCCSCTLRMFKDIGIELKSINLQYNTLVCWTHGTNDSLTKRMVFQVLSFFFHKIFQILCINPFNFFFFSFYKIIKVKRPYKKIFFGTTDTWLMSCFSHWPSKQVYYVVDCLVFRIDAKVQ